MSEIEIGQRSIGAINQQSDATSMASPHRARPSEKQMRAALKDRPAFREIRALLPDIWRVAYFTTYDDHDREHFDECQIVTPTAFWEYLSFAGENLEEKTEDLEFAVKTLQALLAANPHSSK